MVPTCSLKDVPMPSEMIQLFTIDENLAAIRGLLLQLPANAAQDGAQVDPTPQLRQMLKVMVSNAQRFDDLCQENIKWIGPSFMSAVHDLAHQGEQHSSSVSQLFTMAYRFLCELEFSMPGDLSFELHQVKSFVDKNLSNFPEDLKRQLIFANYLMPAAIAKAMLHNPDIVAMRNFEERISSAAALKERWDGEVAQKEEQVKVLKDQLGRLENGFNFVGLVEGFRQLSVQKLGEKRVAFISLIMLGVLVLLPVLLEVLFVVRNLDELGMYQQALVFLLPPLVTIEVLLVYFFRVVLVHFRSIKAQLLQLELRASLCQFIQSYSVYAAEIKKNDVAALDKFESLIFSGLLSNEENLPSTFDGTEQLAKLIKSIKGK